MSNLIGFDGELAGHNAKILYELAGEIPPPAAVVHVSGNTSVPPAASFTDRLRGGAENLANEVEMIRDYVASHADALKQAVAALREIDELGASDADSMTSLINASISGTGVSTSPAPSVATGSRSDSTTAFRGGAG